MVSTSTARTLFAACAAGLLVWTAYNFSSMSSTSCVPSPEADSSISVGSQSKQLLPTAAADRTASSSVADHTAPSTALDARVGCQTYFVMVVLKPPSEGARQEGSFWGGLPDLWASAALTIESILLSQPQSSCVELLLSHADLAKDLPPAITSLLDPAESRVAVQLASSDLTEKYPCWVVALAAAQREALVRHRGKNVVLCEADQYYLCNLEQVFNKLSFDVGYTLEYSFKEDTLNSGVMFVRQVNDTALSWWQLYVNDTKALCDSRGKCLSGSNQMAVGKTIRPPPGSRAPSFYEVQDYPLPFNTRVMRLASMLFNRRYVGGGVDGPCDMRMYADAAVFHTPGTSKGHIRKCQKELKQLLLDANPHLKAQE